MSITSQVDKSGYFLITGLPQTIAVGFPFQSASDLIVYDSGMSGSPREPAATLVLGSDYTVTGGGYNAANEMQTGSITVVGTGANAVLVNDFLVIARNVPINQTTSFQATGPLTIQQVEQALDKTATISQQLNDQGTRSLRFEPREFLDGTMRQDLRKGKVVGFDSSGNLTFYAFVAGSVLPQSVQGTANQVLVNGTSGSAQTGSVTLTTPQDIGTTSQVEFGRIGIGTTPTSTSDLVILHSTPLVTSQASVLVDGGVTAPAATDLHPNAYRDSTGYASSVDGDAYASYDSLASLSGTKNYNHMIGFQARNGFGGSGTLGRLEGFSGFMGVGAGTVTEARVFYVPDLTVSGGTVTHYAGLYIDQLTAGTTRHAIYHAGNDPWFSAGGQIFTSALLTTPAGATTCVIGGTFDQSSQTGLAVMNKSATATGTFASFCNSGGTVQGTITQTNSTTTAYNTSSDSRLKENVRDLSGSGAILDALQPRVFDWKWGGKDAHGFIAQDLFNAYPAAVLVGNDEVTEKGDLLHPWGVDFAKLVPVLTAEIKSLRQRVATLEARP